MGSARRGTREDKARGGSGNTGKPPDNIGLPLTLAGNLVVATRGDGGAGAERGLGGEDKPLGLPLIRNRLFSFFLGFPSVSPSPNFVASITLKFQILV
jgi:hypothetical protein